MNEHKIELGELYKQIRSSESGLSTEEAEKRLKEYGHNTLETKKKIPGVIKFLNQFKNFFALLLILGSMLAFLAEYMSPNEGNFYIGVALGAVVLLNAVFTFIQEYQSEKIMESFKKMMPDKVDVLRDGKRKEILAGELVPGDIIFLSEGGKVPADARLIEENSLKVDNSSITGESEPQLRKTECTHEHILESRNMVFSGTLVQSGNGKAVVYGTGMNTQIGNIVLLTKETKSVETPLHKELRHFIRIISSIAVFLGFSFFIISLLLGHRMIGSLVFAIGIIVANVPEGLLPTVTLCLSMVSKRMAKKNALIKNLESVETLGSTTVICTDKTGTLTKNNMAVNSVFINFREKNVHEKDMKDTSGLLHMMKTMVLCNNSKYDNDDKERKFKGDPTETSLMSFSNNFIDVDVLNKSNPRVHEEPFDSKTKRMITLNQEGGQITAYMKGAPEIVLAKCSRVLSNGEVISLSDENRNMIYEHYKKFASRGERVLAFAYKPVESSGFSKDDENDFVFIALSGMRDPPREGVSEAVEKCRTAGIKVIMITGDYGLTAEAIAREVGMVDNDKEANIITGEELHNMDDDKLKKELEKENIIFARTNPAQKLRIVRALQSMGDVVTVTGDGVNDAPALKNADMGVSMGVSGTEVAREASNMVLMDDNFATIVNAVEEGRNVFENIKKFIAYILTSNIPEIMPFIAFVLLRIPLPLTIVLILAIDLGTDIVPALGLGIEKPEGDVMKRPPRSKDEKLLTSKLLFKSYGLIGPIQAAAGFFSYFVILLNGGWHFGQQLMFNDPLYLKAVSAFFASIVICQIPDVLTCRTRRESIFKKGSKWLFENKLIWLGIFTELFLMSIIVYLPLTQNFFGTHSLTLYDLSLAVPFAVLIVIVEEARKYFVRNENQFFEKYLAW